MSRSISYRKGTSSGFSTAINVRCRNEKINVSVSIHLDGLISITPYVFYMYLPIFIFQRIWSFSSFKCVSPIPYKINLLVVHSKDYMESVLPWNQVLAFQHFKKFHGYIGDMFALNPSLDNFFI